MENLHDYVERDIPIIGLEPSCVAAFQDDYRDLVPSEKTEAVAEQVKMIDQFLAKEWSQGQIDPKQHFQRVTSLLCYMGIVSSELLWVAL